MNINESEVLHYVLNIYDDIVMAQPRRYGVLWTL